MESGMASLAAVPNDDGNVALARMRGLSRSTVNDAPEGAIWLAWFSRDLVLDFRSVMNVPMPDLLTCYRVENTRNIERFTGTCHPVPSFAVPVSSGFRSAFDAALARNMIRYPKLR